MTEKFRRMFVPRLWRFICVANEMAQILVPNEIINILPLFFFCRPQMNPIGYNSFPYTRLINK